MTDSLVGINNDIIAIPLPVLPSLYMEDKYVSVLDNDSNVVIDGGPSVSLVVTNITRQPARGGGVPDIPRHDPGGVPPPSCRTIGWWGPSQRVRLQGVRASPVAFRKPWSCCIG